MGVNFNPSLDGHDAKRKIGLITSAEIVGNAIQITGFVYAADFPATASTIRSLKDVLGFSFEAQRIKVLDPHAGVLTITELAFTGAAILRKDKAAFFSTSLAASATTQRTKIMSYVTQTDITSDKPPLKGWHFHFANKASLLRTMEQLGFEVPGAVTALAAANEPLGKGGHRIDLHQLDSVLAGYDVSPRIRMQLKNELIRQGLLK
jgi:hypothetical protein